MKIIVYKISSEIEIIESNMTRRGWISKEENMLGFAPRIKIYPNS